MSGYSPNLQLAEPTPFDPSAANTWGTTLNTDMGLIDSAVAGSLSLSVAGGSNVVLSSTAGAADQARNQDFVFTGALTGNITVFWPQGLNRFFSVTNDTTGSYTLTLAVNNGSGAPAGSTVTIAQGATQQFKSDGTNVTLRGISAITTGNSDGDVLLAGDDYAVDSSATANSIVASLSVAPASLYAGLKCKIKVANANTGATTFNLNGLGAQPVVKGGTTALTGGELPAGWVADLIYDGTNWQLMAFYPPAVAPTDWASPGTIGSTTPNTAIFTTLEVVDTSIMGGLLTANGGLDVTAGSISVPNGSIANAALVTAPLVSGDNISSLNNNSGYQTAAQVTSAVRPGYAGVNAYTEIFVPSGTTYSDGSTYSGGNLPAGTWMCMNSAPSGSIGEGAGGLFQRVS